MDRIVPRILLFDRFALDLRRGCLRAGEQDIELRPKAFEVLCYLIENAGRLVAHEELHNAVWRDVAVSNDSIRQCARRSQPQFTTITTAFASRFRLAIERSAGTAQRTAAEGPLRVNRDRLHRCGTSNDVRRSPRSGLKFRRAGSVAMSHEQTAC
jgi:hypothetical protein